MECSHCTPQDTFTTRINKKSQVTVVLKQCNPWGFMLTTSDIRRSGLKPHSKDQSITVNQSIESTPDKIHKCHLLIIRLTRLKEAALSITQVECGGGGWISSRYSLLTRDVVEFLSRKQWDKETQQPMPTWGHPLLSPKCNRLWTSHPVSRVHGQWDCVLLFDYKTCRGI